MCQLCVKLEKNIFLFEHITCQPESSRRNSSHGLYSQQVRSAPKAHVQLWQAAFSCYTRLAPTVLGEWVTATWALKNHFFRKISLDDVNIEVVYKMNIYELAWIDDDWCINTLIKSYIYIYRELIMHIFCVCILVSDWFHSSEPQVPALLTLCLRRWLRFLVWNMRKMLDKYHVWSCVIIELIQHIFRQQFETYVWFRILFVQNILGMFGVYNYHPKFMIHLCPTVQYHNHSGNETGGKRKR